MPLARIDLIAFLSRSRSMLGEPWNRNVPFTKQSQTDCTSVSACAGKTCSLVWLKSAKRTGRLATVRRNTRSRWERRACPSIAARAKGKPQWAD
jgi:hypothetical protein